MKNCVFVIVTLFQAIVVATPSNASLTVFVDDYAQCLRSTIVFIATQDAAMTTGVVPFEEDPMNTDAFLPILVSAGVRFYGEAEVNKIARNKAVISAMSEQALNLFRTESPKRALALNSLPVIACQLEMQNLGLWE